MAQTGCTAPGGTNHWRPPPSGLRKATVRLRRSPGGSPGERAREGCAVRIAVGEGDSPNIQQRGRDEKFGHGIESRCRLALLHYRPLADVPGIELRTHGTTLYNSIYRADDQILVNAHVWGVNAYGAPVWHLRRNGDGGMFDTYAGSFNAVWETARPVEE